jgi:hypothetical protein
VEVSHDDVKDASTGVLKDMKRFQGEKEEDLKRYMVYSLHFFLTPTQLTHPNRSPLQKHTSNGLAAIEQTGKRPKQRWRTLKYLKYRNELNH